MGQPLDDLPFDEELLHMMYKEYKLDSIERNNLKEIERMFAEKLFTKNNVKDSLSYLMEFEQKISHIIEVEYKYEGDANYNMNAALKRIKFLIEKLRSIRDN